MTENFKTFEGIIMIIIIFTQIKHIYCELDFVIEGGVVNLHFEGISEINDESFDENSNNLSEVYHLRLLFNRIENISERAFAGFESLTELSLYHNRLKSIILKVEDTPNLRDLGISDNRLTQFPQFCGFFVSLKHLYVDENLISYISADDFENITNIEIMSLSQNRIVSFEPKHELPHLLELWLANNKLMKIPAVHGKNTSLQLMLRLSGNNITEISEGCILNFEARNTYALYLDDNPIEQLPNLYKYTGSNGTKINIYLRGIRFICNNLCWMSRVGSLNESEPTWFGEKGIKTSLFMDQFPCKSPAEAVNMTLKDFLPTFCPRLCDSNPCLNGGTCVELGDEFECQCSVGIGPLCEAACNSQPCQNNGTCIELDDGFRCECSVGVGLLCEAACDSDPCQNGGTCVELDDGFRCECSVGIGPLCEVACDSQPCHNGGTCIDTQDGFRCECSVGVGLLCETEYGYVRN